MSSPTHGDDLPPEGYTDHHEPKDDSMDVDRPHESAEEVQDVPMSPPPVPVEHPDKIEARRKLQRPDGIMEPDCFDALKTYIRHKGVPLETISFLSDNYVGYAELCNLVSQWLRHLGSTDDEILKIVEDFFKQLVKDNFTVDKTDDLFRQNLSAIQWLQDMINTPTWRPLIYDLSNDHKDSLLVGFSIQQISAAGHQDELLSLSAAANDFAVYNRILEHALSKIFRMDSGDMFSFVPELKKMSARHEHTYLYTQALVHMLEMEPNGKSLRRLAEELEAQASSRDPVARKIPFQLTTIGEHPQVLTSLIMMLNAGQSNPADIGRLYNLYSSQSPPPVGFIRRADFIDLLVSEIFRTHVASSSLAHRTQRQQSMYLVAYASCVVDDRPVNAWRPVGDDTDAVPQPELDTSLLDNTRNAIERVTQICDRDYFGGELQSVVERLNDFLPFPVAAYGVILWIQNSITGPDHFETSYNTKSLPVYLSLLRKLAHMHPFLLPKIFELLCSCFETESELDALVAVEAKKTIVDNLVFLLECGHVLPVLVYMTARSTQVDQSICRHLVFRVLDMVGPPYSPTFIDSFLPVLSVLSDKSLSATELQGLVRQLLDDCQEIALELNPGSQILLANLSRALRH